jgi:flagellar biosynthesis/type III secretory pathway protein FliH
MNNRLVTTQNSRVSSSVSQGALTAKALLASAELEAQRIIASAESRAADLIHQAEDQSKQEEERRHTRNRVSSLFAWRRAVTVAKDDLLIMVEFLSKQVLQKELSSNPESILNRIESASEIIENLTSLTLEISESDFSSVKESLKNSDNHFKIKVNTSLTQGEFILATKRSKISSSPNYHLESLLEEFKPFARTFRQLAHTIIEERHD